MFQMWESLQRTYFLKKQGTKNVSIYLNDNLKTQVKIVSLSRRMVLNDSVFIKATFKSHIPKGEVYELGDSRHTLCKYCGRYIRITSEKTEVYLSKAELSCLMDLESFCIDRKVITFCRLQDKLIEWCNKCFETKSFCTPPNTIATDFETSYDELSYRTRLFSQSLL